MPLYQINIEVKEIQLSQNVSLQDHIDYVNIGTPLSNRYYLGSPRGEIYGLDHTKERFSLWNNAILRPKTDIPGKAYHEMGFVSVWEYLACPNCMYCIYKAVYIVHITLLGDCYIQEAVIFPPQLF